MIASGMASSMVRKQMAGGEERERASRRRGDRRPDSAGRVRGIVLREAGRRYDRCVRSPAKRAGNSRRPAPADGRTTPRRPVPPSAGCASRGRGRGRAWPTPPEWRSRASTRSPSESACDRARTAPPPSAPTCVVGVTCQTILRPRPGRRALLVILHDQRRVGGQREGAHAPFLRFARGAAAHLLARDRRSPAP